MKLLCDLNCVILEEGKIEIKSIYLSFDSLFDSATLLIHLPFKVDACEDFNQSIVLFSVRKAERESISQLKKGRKGNITVAKFSWRC